MYTKNKGKFIVIMHSYSPKKGSNPSMKNFGQEGKYEMFEEVHFVDRVKRRHMDSATSILECVTMEWVKNRVDEFTPEKMIEHCKKHYPQQMTEFMKLVEQDKHGIGKPNNKE